MSESFIDVAVRTSMDSGELTGAINDSKFLGSWEEPGILHIYWPEDKWNEEVLADLKRVLDGFGIADADLSIHTLQDRDWNAAWAASWASASFRRTRRHVR